MLADHEREIFYHEDHADEENEGREELETQWDQPCGIRLSLTSTADVVRA